MPCLRVEIVRFVDENQPGIVECVFTDARGLVHRIVDKVPIFTVEDLSMDSTDTRSGIARCEVLEQSNDSDGRKFARVTIARPDSLQSVNGLSEFIVLESQLSEDIWG